MSFLTIQSPRAKATIAPQFGARLLSFFVDDIEVVVWPPNPDYSSPSKIRGGNPILFPVVARHMIDGQVGLARYPGSDEVYKLPMHGFARDNNFKVVEHTDTIIRMLLTDSEATLSVYPFKFAFLVTYALTGPESKDLTVELRTLNLDSKNMPYYPGHHFYFAIGKDERNDWALNIPCQQWGRQLVDGSVEHKPIVAEATTLGHPDLIDNFHIHPTSRFASITNSRTQATIELDLTSPTPWYSLTTWAMSPEHDHYCIEPWLGLPNAVHHSLGLRYLTPDQEESAVCTIRYKSDNTPTSETLSDQIVTELTSAGSVRKWL